MKNTSTIVNLKSCPTHLILDGDGTCCIFLEALHGYGGYRFVILQAMAGGGMSVKAG